MSQTIDIIFLVSRIIVSVFYAFMALGHFTNVENMAGYAKSKGVPFAKLSVIGTGVLLLIAAISIGFGIYPTIGVITATIFFLGVTPKMHDFWNVEDAMQKQGEMINFFKNFAILAATLLFVVVNEWPYSFNITL